MEKLNLDKKGLKKFGITMGVAFLVIGGLIYFKRHHLPLSISFISFAFFGLALFIPLILKPIYIIWMRLAFVLSWINTRLILCIIFYLLFTLTGLAMRLFGKDLLDRKIEKARDSYWKKREDGEFSRLTYERQF